MEQVTFYQVTFYPLVRFDKVSFFICLWGASYWEIMPSTGLVDKNSPLHSLNMQHLTRLNIGFLLPLLTLVLTTIATLNQLKPNNNQHEHHSIFTIPASSRTFNTVSNWFWEKLAFIEYNLITAAMVEVLQEIVGSNCLVFFIVSIECKMCTWLPCLYVH